jgi:erythronate-4-phosphate dehydrogenase
MMHDALVRELGIASTWDGSAALEMSARERAALRPPAWTPGADAAAEARWLHALVRQVCDIEADDARMRTLLTLPAGDRARAFQELRRSYPRRRSFSRYVLPANEIPAPLQRAVREGLRIRPD